ncbi:hypothetical protein SAMN05216232_1976 [Virgibacillus subterraneus]|uniref:Uncharacterized protein n=1 Tax=Virgibacillus subterraneus TaxID=621109 RepID=A0A1H9EBU9_9BACI|nr:hypothetical protein [Virgibacillus subterraneus]SEQ23214.1 hypothetical protein SAMN05216232_1976 [Virgibacillus subterraneus]
MKQIDIKTIQFEDRDILHFHTGHILVIESGLKKGWKVELRFIVDESPLAKRVEETEMPTITMTSLEDNYLKGVVNIKDLSDLPGGRFATLEGIGKLEGYKNLYK